MKQSTPKRTFIVRITTGLAFGELANGLAQLGDVEHVQLKDGSVTPLGNSPLPTKGNMADYVRQPHLNYPNGPVKANGQAYKKRVYSPEGKAKVIEAQRVRIAERHALAVATLSGIMRTHAHAPLIKLVDLMNVTPSRPTINSSTMWTEKNLKPLIDEALEFVTAPSAPKPQG